MLPWTRLQLLYCYKSPTYLCPRPVGAAGLQQVQGQKVYLEGAFWLLQLAEQRGLRLWGATWL